MFYLDQPMTWVWGRGYLLVWPMAFRKPVWNRSATNVNVGEADYFTAVIGIWADSFLVLTVMCRRFVLWVFVNGSISHISTQTVSLLSVHCSWEILINSLIYQCLYGFIPLLLYKTHPVRAVSDNDLIKRILSFITLWSKSFCWFIFYDFFRSAKYLMLMSGE